MSREIVNLNTYPGSDQALIDRVDDAFNYFNGFRLEELKEDDKYYINALMSYIEKLEARTKKLNKQL